MRNLQGVRAIDQQGRTPFADDRLIVGLVQFKLHSVEVDLHRAQTGTGLVEEAELLADKPKGDRVAQRARNVECVLKRAGYTALHNPIPFIAQVRVGVVIRARVERRCG